MYGREYIEWLEGRKEPSWATWRRFYQDQEEGLRAALERGIECDMRGGMERPTNLSAMELRFSAHDEIKHCWCRGQPILFLGPEDAFEH